MKKFGKILFLSTMMFLLAVGSVFSADLDKLQENVGAFAEQMAKSLPFNSTMGLNWSSAYIGKVFPSIPPHFGVGATFGLTFLDVGDMNKMLGMFGSGNDIGGLGLGLPLPGYTVEGRVGGIILPFDVGFKIGALPEAIPLLNALGIGLEYMLVGGDIRYSIIPDKIPVIRASVGLGINRLNGGISKSLPGQEFAFGEDFTLKVDDPTIGLRWKTTCFELKAHASAKIPLIPITPYGGLGFSFAKSNAGYAIDSNIKMIDKDGAEVVNAKAILEELKKAGFSDIDVSSDGIESMYDNNAWNLRVFGGVSFNLTKLYLDFTAMYNVFTSNSGFTFGARFQL